MREREKQGVGEWLSGREREREREEVEADVVGEGEGDRERVRINMEEEAGALILPLAFYRDPKNRNRKGLIIITLHNTAESYPVVLFWQPGIHDRMKLSVFFFCWGGGEVNVTLKTCEKLTECLFNLVSGQSGCGWKT